VVTEGPLTGTSLPLREAGTLIGRSPECALVLEDDFASGRHARIFQRDGAWFVEDLGSTNGTFLGTERVTGTARVEAGTRLRVGKTVVELRR
jgi:pSer/pThr/pTyr-binding forkhead associated (FHA) protein